MNQTATLAAREIDSPEAGHITGKSTARQPDSGTQRKRLFGIFGAVLAVTAVGYGSYWWMVKSRYVSTDNAYVEATSAEITPQVAAAVTEVRVKDTQPVHAGDVLVVLDNADASLAVSQARAQLGQVTRRVEGYFASDAALAAQIRARAAEIDSARSDLERARTDYQRRKVLSEGGAVSTEDLTTAENRLRQATAAMSSAQAQLLAAEGNRRATEVLIAGASVADNPEVIAARTQLEQASLNLSRTIIRAPIDGVVARRSVQVGQRVQVGASLMSIVPVSQAYVNANFKEGQLERVKVGQPVELQSDLYGSSVTFHGRVTGLAGGTGSAFSVIPAQNATGNWIKVVQRLPVRIEMDPKELSTHPLSVGLSMKVVINTAS
jgi:membrane fusion protein (multidrug efflux system)